MIAAPYTRADYADAAPWLDYVAAAYAPGLGTVAEADAAARAAIDKAERHGLITGAVARVLLEVFDLSPLDMA